MPRGTLGTLGLTLGLELDSAVDCAGKYRISVMAVQH